VDLRDGSNEVPPNRIAKDRSRPTRGARSLESRSYSADSIAEVARFRGASITTHPVTAKAAIRENLVAQHRIGPTVRSRRFQALPAIELATPHISTASPATRIALAIPRKFTDVLLPALGMVEVFEVAQTGDNVTHGEPAPEIYVKCMGRLGVVPSECAVLEDSPAGALAGKRAGACVIAVPTDLTAGEDFSFADAQAANLFEAAYLLDRVV
jgi:beta-phosphoglucomutase-like phosphatase (HAD superfamily)